MVKKKTLIKKDKTNLTTKKIQKSFNKNMESKSNLIYRLQLYYGINEKSAEKVISLFGCSKLMSVYSIKYFDKTLLNEIELFIRKVFLLEKNLKDVIKFNFDQHIKIKSYKGKRLGLLPLNGQRTKTNRQNAKKFNLKKYNVKYYKDVYKLEL